MDKKFIELPEIYQDGMMLQRNKDIYINGTSAFDQMLTVKIDDMDVYAGSVTPGAFTLILPAQEAAEDICLTIKSDHGESLVIRNVDIGEVWLAGGQSNMEFPLLCDRKGDETIRDAADPHFRYYEVGKYCFEGEREEHLKDDSRWNQWRQFIPNQCDHFSAVGTYFAKYLRKALKVPVAVIGCCWGGTSASAWLDEKLLREDPVLCIYANSYDKATAGQDPEKYRKSDYKYRSFMGTEKSTIGNEMQMKNEADAPLKPLKKLFVKMMAAQMLKTGPHDPTRPGGLYQTMLMKIAGFTIRGVIWYQGENDEMHADIYGRLFTKVIECWRELWKEDLPFLFVLLPQFEEWMITKGTRFPILRAQQQSVEDQVPGCHMASIMDAGSRYDIHPKDKTPVGQRLALLALNDVYEIPQKYAHAPRMDKIARNGENIRISFRYAEDGLIRKGEITDLFSVKQGGKIFSVTAALDGNEVVLHCDKLKNGPAEISFAFRPYIVMTLFNRGGLPARPSAWVSF